MFPLAGQTYIYVPSGRPNSYICSLWSAKHIYMFPLAGQTYIYIYMFPLAGQTYIYMIPLAGQTYIKVPSGRPNSLTEWADFFVDTHGKNQIKKFTGNARPFS